MKIALVCSDKGPCPPIRGGAIQLLISRVSPLLAKKHQVTVFSIADPELPRKEKLGGVQYKRFPLPTYIHDVCKQLEKQQFDVIQVFNRPQWITPLRNLAPRASLVLSLHNRIYQWMVPGLQEADKILTVSDYLAKHTARKLPQIKKNMETLYTGVDLTEYAPVWTSKGRQWREEIRSHYQIGEDEPVLLFVGRLVAYKGCHVILRAMREILHKHPKAKLLVVGSKWYADHAQDDYTKELFQIAGSMPGHVIFTSYVPVDDIPKYYAASDLFICPSQWQEPLARVHYEAMAAGLPIVTTRRGGNHEVMRDGINGLIVQNHKDPAQFAHAANTILSDPDLSRKMGRRGRELAEKMYNFERVADDLDSIYTLLHSRKKERKTKKR